MLARILPKITISNTSNVKNTSHRKMILSARMIVTIYWHRQMKASRTRTGRVYLRKTAQEDIGGVASVILGSLIDVIIVDTARGVL
jgi:hypothetical protein